MTTHERFFRPSESSRTSAHLHRTLDSDLAARKARPGCGSVARGRARRYLAKRRMPKALWPIVAAVILIAIIFGRQVQPILLDNDVIREKWRHLDRISLPLVVFLRHVEANEEWSILEAEIARFPLSSDPATRNADTLSSLRHRRIIELTREWQRRGEEMLLPSTPKTAVSAENEKPDPSDDDDRRPKP